MNSLKIEKMFNFRGNGQEIKDGHIEDVGSSQLWTGDNGVLVEQSQMIFVSSTKERTCPVGSSLSASCQESKSSHGSLLTT